MDVLLFRASVAFFEVPAVFTAAGFLVLVSDGGAAVAEADRLSPPARTKAVTPTIAPLAFI
jgi:hypothetical protein